MQQQTVTADFRILAIDQLRESQPIRGAASIRRSFKNSRRAFTRKAYQFR